MGYVSTTGNSTTLLALQIPGRVTGTIRVKQIINNLKYYKGRG